VRGAAGGGEGRGRAVAIRARRHQRKPVAVIHALEVGLGDLTPVSLLVLKLGYQWAMGRGPQCFHQLSDGAGDAGAWLMGWARLGDGGFVAGVGWLAFGVGGWGGGGGAERGNGVGGGAQCGDGGSRQLAGGREVVYGVFHFPAPPL